MWKETAGLRSWVSANTALKKVPALSDGRATWIGTLSSSAAAKIALYDKFLRELARQNQERRFLSG